jgi:hypothetical protein
VNKYSYFSNPFPAGVAPGGFNIDNCVHSDEL